MTAARRRLFRGRVKTGLTPRHPGKRRGSRNALLFQWNFYHFKIPQVWPERFGNPFSTISLNRVLRRPLHNQH